MYTDIIWDFDGTLIDTYPGTVEAFQRSLRDEKIAADADEILKFMKKSAAHAIEHYKASYNLNENFIRRFSAYEDEIEDSKRIPYEGVKEICEGVVNSGGRNFIVTHRGNSTLKVLEYHKMLGLFTEIVTRHNGFKRKPDPEAFIYIIDKYKIDKSKALGVGDRELDILAAHNAGIKTCLFESDEVSCSIEPDFTIKTLYSLGKIISGN